MLLLLALIALLLRPPSVMSDDVLKLIDSESGLIKSDELTNLTTLALYSIRPERLSNLSGIELASVGLKHGQDAALFQKPLEACAHRHQRTHFLKAMAGSKEALGEGAQRLMAEALITWYPDLDNNWKFELFKSVLESGTPLLAYLPPNFLFMLQTRHQQKFLYHLQQWSWPNSRAAEWVKKSVSVRRTWAEMLVFSDPTALHQFSPQRLQFIDFILTGNTPDELEKLKLKEFDSQNVVLALPLAPMQLRAVFSSVILSRAKPRTLQASLAHLTPAQLALLAYGNFSHAARQAFERREHPVSWASAAQIAFVLLNEAHEGKASWDAQTVSQVGKWIHALPNLQLVHAARVIEDLKADKRDKILNEVDSAQLSGKQARTLIGQHLSHPNVTLDATLQLQHNLLLAVPSSKIATKSILPQVVITHLLTKLPAQSTAIHALFSKVRNMTNASWVLESMFGGRQSPQRFASLMSLEDIKGIVIELGQVIWNSRNKDGWPLPFLQIVAQEIYDQMNDISEWAEYLLTNPQIISGLSCKHLMELGPNYGLPILSKFGQFLNAHNLKYPKDLRKCSLYAILSYLKNRADAEAIENNNLLDTLYSAEISSIGGFPFTHVPFSVIKSSKNVAHMMKAIGRLSVEELLETFVLPGATPQLFTRLAMSLADDGSSGLNLESLGNLLQFLPNGEVQISQMDSRAVRLWLERMQRPTDSALCVSKAARATFWYRIIRAAYGPPSGWSAGTVVGLGGLLVAVPPSKLAEVPTQSMINAADQLDATFGYTPKFIKLCGRYLGSEEAKDLEQTIKTLMKVVLRATNELAATVQTRFERKRKSEDNQKSGVEKIFRLQGNLNPERPFSIVLPHLRAEEANVTARKRRATRAPAVSSDLEDAPLKNHQVKAKQNNSTLFDSAGFGKSSNNVKLSRNEKMSCGAFQMAPLSTILTLETQDLQALHSAEQLTECLPYFGTLDLSAIQIRNISNFMKQNDVHVDVLDLGVLASQVEMDAVRSSDLTNVDVVATLGFNLQSWDLLDNITDLVLEAHNVTDSLPAYLAVNLGRLICGERIWRDILLTPSIFLEIYPSLASSFSKSTRCPPLNCLERLLAFSERIDVFGPISTWTAGHFTIMGTIMAGLNSNTMAKLSSQPEVNGLQPGAFKCLQTSALKVMDEAYLRHLTPTSLDSIFYYRFRELSGVQQSQVRRALVSSPAHAFLASPNYTLVDTWRLQNADASSAFTNVASLLIIALTSIFIVKYI